MKSENFAYWLQGLFELVNPSTLNEKQIDLIKRHLDMVFIHEKQPSRFCIWLREHLEFSQAKTFNQNQTNILKDKLNKEFVHVIDPSYPQDQQQALDNAHSGNAFFDFPYEPGMKC